MRILAKHLNLRGVAMQVYKEGDHWVIARNFRLVGGGGITGSRVRAAGREVQIYDCWTGERWWGQKVHAFIFPTQEAAQRYLDDNLERLEQSP